MADPFDVFDSWGNKIGEIMPPGDNWAGCLVSVFLWIFLFSVFIVIFIVISPVLLLIQGVKLYRENKKELAIACWVGAAVIAIFIGVVGNNMNTRVYTPSGATIKHALVESNFSGKWKGSYIDKDVWGRGYNILFEMELKQNETEITGITTERRDYRTLTARIDGRVEGRVIRFVKQYNEGPPVWPIESIKYEGNIADNGNSISGTWKTSVLTGGWSVSRVSKAKIDRLSSTAETLEKVTIASLTRDIPDSDYFIEQSKIFDASFDVVWTATNKYFAKYKITVIDSDPTKGVLVSASLVKPTSFLQLPFKIDFHSAEGSRTTTPSIRTGGTQSQIFILIERVSENSTKVTAKSFCYKEYANGWQRLDPRPYSEKTLKYIEQEVKRQQKIR